MIKFKHRMPNVNSGDLRTPVSFYEYAPNEGPEPGESETRILFECFAEIQKTRMRDLEQAKANNTLDDVTVRIRDPYGSYTPTNKHYLGINDRNFFEKRYNIKSVQPDMRNRGFIVIVAGVAR